MVLNNIDEQRNSNSGAKLHQLLDASPRADAVAAGWWNMQSLVIYSKATMWFWYNYKPKIAVNSLAVDRISG